MEEYEDPGEETSTALGMQYLNDLINRSQTLNQCIVIQDGFPDTVDNLSVQFIFGLLYSCVLLVGLSGNLFVIYSILVKRVTFTVRTVFVLSLACSDIIIGISSLPVTAIGIFTRVWIFGRLVCHTVGFVQGSHIFISSFTLIAIAIDRYFLIVHPHKNLVTYNSATRAVVATWILGYIIAIPLALFVHLREYNPETARDQLWLCGSFCEETWPSGESRMLYGFCVLCIQFGVPLLANTLCYVAINRQIQQQAEKRAASQILLPKAQLQLNRRRRRTTIMTITMLASFVLAWLPINFLNIARDFSFDTFFFEEFQFNTAFAAAHLISMTSIIWNPLIYMGFQNAFRKLVANAARCQVDKTVFTSKMITEGGKRFT